MRLETLKNILVIAVCVVILGGVTLWGINAKLTADRLAAQEAADEKARLEQIEYERRISLLEMARLTAEREAERQKKFAADNRARARANRQPLTYEEWEATDDPLEALATSKGERITENGMYLLPPLKTIVVE